MPAIPKLIESAAEMAAYSRESISKRLALVPTMGALHRGHYRLIEEAKRQSDKVVVSIFVNPTQFGANEDLDKYPRTLEADMDGLTESGIVDAVFAPTVGEMYPDGIDRQEIWVEPSHLADHLCGAFRPGHFRGVATIVTKLLAVCRPDVAVFGLKDAQQFVILKKMAIDLGFQVQIVGVPTMRESDGLALSSRNRFLSPHDRRQAVLLSQAVEAARLAIEAGERDAEIVRLTMTDLLSQASSGVVQYADVVDAETLRPISEIREGSRVLSAVSVFFGSTRLIDNSFAVAA